jgi:hypothetical protein
MSTVRLNTKGLDKLIAAMKGPQYSVQVGVLGGKVTRTEEKTTLTYEEVVNLKKPIRQGKKLNNAEIGAIHEYGDATHPVRSFLRVPLATRLQKELEESNAFSPDAFSEVLRTGSSISWLKKLAIVAEKVVIEAFYTGGYGKWPKWAGNYTSNTGMILQDTTQLRQSISSRVVEK